jgi:hypothetical protein
MSILDIRRRPKWPADPIEPTRTWVDYAVVADEFLVYFPGKPVPAISSPLNTPMFYGTSVMFGVGPDDEATDEIVGVHVIPMLLGAVQAQPHWAVLAWAAMAGEYGTELLRERLPPFLDEVAAAFDAHWTPPSDDVDPGTGEAT